MKGFCFRYNLKENIGYDDIILYYNRIKTFFDIDFYTWFGIVNYFIDDKGYIKSNNQHYYKKNIDKKILSFKETYNDYNTIAFEKNTETFFLHLYCSYERNSIHLMVTKNDGLSENDKDKINMFLTELLEAKGIVNYYIDLYQ